VLVEVLRLHGDLSFSEHPEDATRDVSAGLNEVIRLTAIGDLHRGGELLHLHGWRVFRPDVSDSDEAYLRPLLHLAHQRLSRQRRPAGLQRTLDASLIEALTEQVRLLVMTRHTSAAAPRYDRTTQQNRQMLLYSGWNRSCSTGQTSGRDETQVPLLGRARSKTPTGRRQPPLGVKFKTIPEEARSLTQEVKGSRLPQGL